MLRFKSLGSGSTGNATVVEARSGTLCTRILIDCGLGIRVLDSRLAQAGLAVEDIDAIFITHEHSDHIGCVHKLSLRHRIPVYMSRGTYEGTGGAEFDGLLRLAADGVQIELGALQIVPFTVPHDAREPLQLSCGDGASRLGVLTDLGHATAHVLSHLQGCAAMLLECNHDPELLAASSYPAFLKRRVGGLHGHLANSVSAEIAATLRASGLRQVVAAHLSQQNNRPDLARAALSQALGCSPGDDAIGVASAAEGSIWRTV
jgi:phosphoribosyl 1,2-cyclic phosphodiesterase